MLFMLIYYTTLFPCRLSSLRCGPRCARQPTRKKSCIVYQHKKHKWFRFVSFILLFPFPFVSSSSLHYKLSPLGPSSLLKQKFSSSLFLVVTQVQKFSVSVSVDPCHSSSESRNKVLPALQLCRQSFVQAVF